LYRIFLKQDRYKHELEELTKIFIKPNEYIFYGSADKESPSDFIGLEGEEMITIPDFPESHDNNKEKEKSAKNQMKRYLFDELHKLTGLSPDWGIITGIRPVKMTQEIMSRGVSVEKAKKILLEDYYITEDKADLLINLCNKQAQIVKKSQDHAVGLYLGIPFCPTRCLYCSFTSNQADDKILNDYLEALYAEISYVSEQMRLKGWYPETIYIGGGTPTTLNHQQLRDLLVCINNSFDLTHLRELTLEAGRPDTLTAPKLKEIKNNGVHRISINPQSMKQETLKLIGRTHSPEDIIKAFELAKEADIPIINADIIAGLPEENEKDFTCTLEKVIDLQPENITVHTLALKRTSRLKQIDEGYHYKQGIKVREMLETSGKLLSEAGYEPYYLYRQKQMIGNFENVGYAKPGTEGIYNIRIMEEKQTIIALGAGGISKVYFHAENRLERVANVSNHQQYIQFMCGHSQSSLGLMAVPATANHLSVSGRLYSLLLYIYCSTASGRRYLILFPSYKRFFMSVEEISTSELFISII
jgi:coproporphyrinogen dehydrogenase HemZ